MAKAGRPRGTAKTGGRKVGTPNKRTADLADRLAVVMGAQWCPVVALAQIAADPATSIDMRVRCLSEVAPYLQAKRKAVELHPGTLEGLLPRMLGEQIKAAHARVAASLAADALRPRIEITTGVFGGLVGGDQAPDTPAPASAVVTAHAAPASLDTAPEPPKPVPAPPRLTAITEAAAWAPDLSPQLTEPYDPYA